MNRKNDSSPAPAWRAGPVIDDRPKMPSSLAAAGLLTMPNTRTKCLWRKWGMTMALVVILGVLVLKVDGAEDSPFRSKWDDGMLKAELGKVSIDADSVLDTWKGMRRDYMLRCNPCMDFASNSAPKLLALSRNGQYEYQFLMKTAILFLTGLCAAVATTLAAADLPELVLPEGVGVNIHFTTGHERDLDLIAAAGCKFVRMDFGWGGIERRKDDFNWADYDELTDSLERHGLRAIYILDYSNPLFEEMVVGKNPLNGQEHKDVASPQHPESVAAFARWAAASAKHFAGRRIIWEIWNEPNISFWKPKPDARQYSTLALAAAKAVREADPNATIIGPATSQVPVKFIEEFFAAGGLANLDAVSVHPYRSYAKGPETAAEDYAKLRALIELHAPAVGKKRLPIISGEWGYSTFTNKCVSLQTQAAFLVRQQLANLLAGVPISIWYDWKNDGTDLNEPEQNFGVVTHDLKPKPSYTALQFLTRELSGFHIEHRLATASTNDFVLLLSNNGRTRKLAAWTTGEAHAITIGDELNNVRSISAIHGDGHAAGAKLEQGRIRLTLGSMPQYVTLKR